MTLWAAGPPSSKKNPGVTSGLKIYKEIQDEFDKQFDKEMKLYEKDDHDSLKPKHKLVNHHY